MTGPDARRGLWAGIGAYGLWGVLALYWRLLDTVPPAEILANRIVWCFVFAAAALRLRGSLQPAVDVLCDPSSRRAVFASTALIGINWFLFIWAVAERRVTEVSLGYYINPLFNVALGALVLGERLSRLQLVSVALAALGIVSFTVSLGSLPWLSVVLPLTFGLYGLVRKTARAGPLVGLVLETALLAPGALVYLVVWPPVVGGHLVHGPAPETALLLFGGPLTALPLLLFAAAARRLEYATLGMLQYIAPTLQLACAVWAFDEPFTARHAVTFAFVWAGVFTYAVAARRRLEA